MPKCDDEEWMLAAVRFFLLHFVPVVAPVGATTGTKCREYRSTLLRQAKAPINGLQLLK